MKKVMIIVTVVVMVMLNVTMIENVKEYVNVRRDGQGESIEKVTVEEGLFFNKETREEIGYRNLSDEDYGKANWEL